ncbi:MAG: FAD-dependent monooxygenase, partial [Acetobacteraceae bacterium]|nr:FAD-dependent monooxygenase [Acetobacteraceae bacterium]
MSSGEVGCGADQVACETPATLEARIFLRHKVRRKDGKARYPASAPLCIGRISPEIHVSCNWMNDSTIIKQCCIAGGGPAGMMLGFLLARAGVEVVVLEKHADFFRDFRGDTVHPSTLELMYELGILDAFRLVPHQEIDRMEVVVGGSTVPGPDLRRLPTHCKFIALTPQWEFLNFLAEQAKRFPSFELRLQNEAVDLIRDDGRVAGVRVRTPNGEEELRGQL